MRSGVRYVLLQGGGARFDTASQAIFAAFTTPPTAQRQVLINTAVVALKSAGVWTLLDALYLFAAADSQAAKVNWANPGTYTASLQNSVAFSADRGFTGNNTDSFVVTNFNPATAPSPKFVQNSAHFGCWNRTQRAGAAKIITGQTGGGNNIYPRFTDNLAYLRVNDAVEAEGFSVTNSDGLFLANRSGASARQGYRNGVSLGTYASNTSQAVANTNVLVGAGGIVFSDDQLAAASVGGSLDATKQLALYNALLAYLQGVGAA